MERARIVGGGQYRHIFGFEHQTDARFIAQLQAVRGEILTFGLGGIFRLARFDGNAHGGELGAIALELLGECALAA